MGANMKGRLVAGAAVIGIALTGCGGSSGPSADATTSAKAASLLPAVSGAPTGMKVSTAPYQQTTTATTLLGSVSDPAKIGGQLASAGETDFSGPRASFAYAHVYVFQTLDDATAAAADFLKTNELKSELPAPSDAPGDESQASTEKYATGTSASFRVVFRDHNVLSYVEVDAPNGTYSVDDTVALANAVDAKIQPTLK